MSRYTVVWLPGALDELARIWLSSTARGSLTAAAAEAERTLAADPLRASSVVAEGLYKLRVEQVVLYFAVSEADRRVEVSNVVLLPPT